MNMPLVLLNRRRRGTGFNPASLFGLNEQGVWYDPSDVANLTWRRNLLTWTEQFDNSYWVKAALLPIVANSSAAPDGTTTADKLIASTANDTHYVNRTVSLVGAHTLSAFFKASGYNRVIFGDGSGTAKSLLVDLQTGAIVSTGSSVSNGSVQAVGNGWFRVSFTITDVLGFTAFIDNGSVVFAGNGTDGIYIWGAQLELGSVATDYQRITDVNTEVVERFPTATLYQDTIGTIPVTTPGQAVALMLDKSKGLVLGPELVTNGDFASGTTDWLGFGAGTGWNVTDGKAVHTAGTYGTIRKDTTLLPLVAGKSYLMTFSLSGRTASSVYAYGGGVLLTTTPISANQEYRYIFTAIATGTMVGFEANTAFDGAIDNISVRELPGNHAVQATAASRPLYGIVPRGGRRNLLTYTEQFDNVNWGKTSSTVAANTSVSPDGTLTADTITGTGADGRCLQSLTVIGGASYTFSVWLRADTPTTASINGVNTGFAVNVTTEWQRFSTTQSWPSTESRFPGVRGVDLGESVYVWGAQLETGSTATAYQKVTTQYDVTEAGVQSLSYLAFDGASDSMATGTITPGIDKIQMFAGIRKLSEVAGVVAELSTTSAGFDGTFTLNAPSGGSDYFWRSRGTVSASGSTAASYPAPITSVMTGLGDIAGDISKLRHNGTEVLNFTTDQGTGNFLAYPIYIGARGGTSLFFNGQLYGLITRFGPNLASTNINATEYWLNEKTGAY